MHFAKSTANCNVCESMRHVLAASRAREETPAARRSLYALKQGNFGRPTVHQQISTRMLDQPAELLKDLPSDAGELVWRWMARCRSHLQTILGVLATHPPKAEVGVPAGSNPPGEAAGLSRQYKYGIHLKSIALA